MFRAGLQGVFDQVDQDLGDLPFVGVDHQVRLFRPVGTDRAAGSTFTISSNTTLFAKWTANTHNVTMPAADTYGTYTMDAKKAAELVNILRPEVAIPVHYGSVVGKPADGETFAELIEPSVRVELKIKF